MSDDDEVILVCAEASEYLTQLLPDNLFGECADCGCRVVYRPHSPQPATRICMTCAATRMETSGGCQVMPPSAETIEELRRLGLLPRQH
jgi:hypothetical protein